MVAMQTDRPVELPVSLYGTHIGELVSLGRSRSIFRWSDAADERWGLNSAALSMDLRIGSTNEEQTDSFFGALLPEGAHLDRLAVEAKVASNDVAGLLGHVGADLAGALRVGDERAAREPVVLTTEEIEQLLVRASGFLVGGGGSALPGFQRKLTLTRIGGQWTRGNGTLPSTHILKPVGEQDRASVESENYTLAVARRLGLLAFDSWVEQIGSHMVLVIERYDRVRRGDTVTRLHQEDAAQALGLPWNSNAKFESVDARASLASIAGLLDRGRTVFSPGRPDAEKLLRYTVLNVAAGNTDAHAKNFSFLHDEAGRTRLAPYYDASPLALAYGGTQALAMRVNGRTQQPDVTRSDLVQEAVSWGLAESSAVTIVDSALEEIVDATRELEAHESIERHVPGYIRGQAENLRAGRPARIPSAVPLMALKRLGTEQPERSG